LEREAIDGLGRTLGLGRRWGRTAGCVGADRRGWVVGVGICSLLRVWLRLC
jgi:hypothetical protein